MKQLEHFEPKETYIRNILEDIISKGETPIERNILSDLVGNKIGILYGYLGTRIEGKNDIEILNMGNEIFSLEETEFITKLEELLKIYEETRDNKEMVKEILKHANGKTSMFEEGDLEKIYKKIKSCKI